MDLSISESEEEEKQTSKQKIPIQIKQEPPSKKASAKFEEKAAAKTRRVIVDDSD